MKRRIQAIIAQYGICSRRLAENLIQQGRVTVNGQTAAIGMSADEDADKIEVDGQPLRKTDTEYTYVMLHKPTGVVTTMSDEKGRKTVADLVADIGKRIYPVGRLDLMSSGLLIMTNDGSLAHRLTHPSHEIDKQYVVSVTGRIDAQTVKKLSSGLVIDGYKTSPAKVEIIDRSPNGGKIKVTIHEGRNRQVRKMCAICGLSVKSLRRTAVGELELGNLEYGKWRFLKADEIEYLKNGG